MFTTIVHNIGTIFIIIVLIFDAYVGWDFYQRYQAHEPKTDAWYHKAFDAALDSLTILWTKICTALATLVMFLDPIADFLGGEDAKNFLHQWVGNPKILTAIILGITAVTFFARMRTLAVKAV